MQPLGFNFSLPYLMPVLRFWFQHHSARNHTVKSQLDDSTCLAEPQLLPTNQILFVLFIFRVMLGMRLYKYARMRYTSWLTPPSHAAIGTEAGSSGTWRALNPSCIQVSPSFCFVTFSAQRKAPLFSKVFAAWSYTEGNSSGFFIFFLFPSFLFFHSGVAQLGVTDIYSGQALK